MLHPRTEWHRIAILTSAGFQKYLEANQVTNREELAALLNSFKTEELQMHLESNRLYFEAVEDMALLWRF